MEKLWTTGIEWVGKLRLEVTFLDSLEGLFIRPQGTSNIYVHWHIRECMLSVWQTVNVPDFPSVSSYEPMQTLSHTVWPNVPTKRLLVISKHGLYFSMLMDLLTSFSVLHCISHVYPEILTTFIPSSHVIFSIKRFHVLATNILTLICAFITLPPPILYSFSHSVLYNG